jgi:hypothetical protein
MNIAIERRLRCEWTRASRDLCIADVIGHEAAGGSWHAWAGCGRQLD